MIAAYAQLAGAAATPADLASTASLPVPPIDADAAEEAAPATPAFACIGAAADAAAGDLESGHCVMCVDAPSSGILAPCGHQCICR